MGDTNVKYIYSSPFETEISLNHLVKADVSDVRQCMTALYRHVCINPGATLPESLRDRPGISRSEPLGPLCDVTR